MTTENSKKSENSGLKRSILMKSLEQFEKENPTVDDQARTDFSVGFDYGWDEYKKAVEKVLDDEIRRHKNLLEGITPKILDIDIKCVKGVIKELNILKKLIGEK